MLCLLALLGEHISYFNTHIIANMRHNDKKITHWCFFFICKNNSIIDKPPKNKTNQLTIGTNLTICIFPPQVSKQRNN
jgi:hypothetical protein